jgi:hypothetical protein
MKTLKNISISVSNGKTTITGDIADEDPRDHRFPSRQTTELYRNLDNPKWPRHIQLTPKGVFVKAFGNSFILKADDLVNIASRIEPKTTFPPLFRQKTGTLQVELCSELKPDLQWQVSDSLAGPWTDVPGQTNPQLDQTTVKKGQFVRLKASSEAGEMASTAAKV